MCCQATHCCRARVHTPVLNKPIVVLEVHGKRVLYRDMLRGSVLARCVFHVLEFIITIRAEG